MAEIHQWVDVEKGVLCKTKERLTVENGSVSTERYVETEDATVPTGEGIKSSLTPLIPE